jgi:hypothetical protein
MHSSNERLTDFVFWFILRIEIFDPQNGSSSVISNG